MKITQPTYQTNIILFPVVPWLSRKLEVNFNDYVYGALLRFVKPLPQSLSACIHLGELSGFLYSAIQQRSLIWAKTGEKIPALLSYGVTFFGASACLDHTLKSIRNLLFLLPLKDPRSPTSPIYDLWDGLPDARKALPLGFLQHTDQVRFSPPRSAATTFPKAVEICYTFFGCGGIPLQDIFDTKALVKSFDDRFDQDSCPSQTQAPSTHVFGSSQISAVCGRPEGSRALTSDDFGQPKRQFAGCTFQLYHVVNLSLLVLVRQSIIPRRF
jgi:hypothetical protein